MKKFKINCQHFSSASLGQFLSEERDKKTIITLKGHLKIKKTSLTFHGQHDREKLRQLFLGCFKVGKDRMQKFAQINQGFST